MLPTRRRLPIFLFLLALTCATAPGSGSPASAADLQPALRDYAQRVPTMRKAIPDLTASATAAAERILEKPGTLLNVPYWEQLTFSEEMINRAGGLAHAFPSGVEGRDPTGHDIVLMSVRSWEQFSDENRQKLRTWRETGDLVILIASAAGKPEDLAVDHFIDNGAPDGSAAHGRINVLANITLGWMWCCEYAAALTRHGKAPGVLYSIAFQYAEAHNQPLQRRVGRDTLLDTDTPVEGGKLAELYLQRIEQLVADLGSEKIQAQIDQAAEVIVQRLAAGKKVGVSGVGHTIIDEPKRDMRSPMIGFQTVGLHETAFTENLDPGDLLVWIAYLGMNSAYVDFAKYIEQAEVDVITSYAPWPGEEYEGPAMIEHEDEPYPALAHIDQSWVVGDAEVPVPFAPGRMAPVSGVNSGLILRMLDDAVAARVGAEQEVEAEAAN